MDESKDEDLKLKSLQAIFNGVDKENRPNFTFFAKRKEGVEEAYVRLISNSNYLFADNKNELISKVVIISVDVIVLDVAIVKEEITQKIIDDAILVLNATPPSTDLLKITSLNTVFTNVSADNFKNFTYEAIATNGAVAGKITLTTKEGFIFGKIKELVSEVSHFNDLGISTPIHEAVSQSNINTAITFLNDSDSNFQEDVKIIILNTVFTGVTVDNFKNFTIDAIATNGEVLGTITLKAKKGFIFDTTKKLVSKIVEIL
ncbi:MAG: hypothetical protein KFW07_00965 [Mycoplasmataceae bacterium]|nr:hypothetical protein [Mycoplasmataceae bacterium]